MRDKQWVVAVLKAGNCDDVPFNMKRYCTANSAYTPKCAYGDLCEREGWYESGKVAWMLKLKWLLEISDGEKYK